MSNNVHELRPKTGDTEKITINLGFVDLGHIDLLVQEGFYSNRTDFIRTAIRNQTGRHDDVVRKAVTRKSVDLGLRHFTRADLEGVRDAGQMLDIRVLGLASLAEDVTPNSPGYHRVVVRTGRASRKCCGQGRARRSHGRFEDPSMLFLPPN